MTRKGVWFTVLVAACSLIVVIAIVGYLIWVNMKPATLDLEENTLTTPVAENVGTVNVAIMGVDGKKGVNTQDNRSDTILVAHINWDKKQTKVVSFPRDLLVPTPACAKKLFPEPKIKLNATYQAGGASCAINAITMLTGAPIHHAASIDFAGFSELIDHMGGLNICVKRNIDDPQAHLKIAAGQHVLTGEQALGLMRARKTLADGSDTERIKRQQIVLKAIMKQAADSVEVTNPQQVLSIISALGKHVSVDSELVSIPNILSMGQGLMGMLSNNGVSFQTYPSVPAGDGENVVPEMPAAEKMNLLLQDKIVPDSSPTAATTSPSPSSKKVDGVCAGEPFVVG